MAANLQTETGQSVGELVMGIIHDAQALISQQLTLFKQEVRQDFRNLLEAMVFLALASGILFVAALLLALMLVHLVHYLAPSWPEWVCYALGGGGFAAVGGGFAALGREKLRAKNVLPEQSAKALTENLEWKTKPS
jgi:hypothetical protein